MASTVNSTLITEHHEDLDTLEAKLDALARLVSKARGRVVFFTGAGVSTSAGIRDYRGPTGAWTQRRIKELQSVPSPAAWEKEELHKLEAEAAKKGASVMVPKEGAVPTTSHMTMATMIRLNMARHVVTTNLDGLHRKSGLEHHRNLTCLHGDRYIERCTNPACRHELERDRSVRQLFARSHLHVHDHSIGVCPKCGSAPPVRYTGMPGPGDDRSGMVGPTDEDCGTKDTHINFGEELDSLDWDEAGAACSAAALCIVAGTSMSLRHVTHFPFLAKKTVIVNLQETPDDQKADLRIFANSDEVFEGLMQRMNIPIDPRPDHQARDAVPKAEVPFFRNKRRWVRLQKAFVQGEWADFATRRALALLWNAAGMQFWRRRAVEGGLAAFQTSGTENEELLRSASDLSLDADIERVRSELSQ